MSIVDKAKEAAVRQAFQYLKKDPKNNVIKVIGLARELTRGDENEVTLIEMEKWLKDPNSVWYQYYVNLWRDIDAGVLERLFKNFAINATFSGQKIQKDLSARLDCNIPWAILMDPTSSCNLHCTGCWAADYGSKMNLSWEAMESIVRQGKALGTHFYIFSGGEPLVRKGDIIRLCEDHPDCEFLAFTNGTLVDEAFADEMLRVKNFIPAFSVEGFEEATDARRGKGTFQKLRRGMEILRGKRLGFGVSCCYTSSNAAVIGSEEYYDALIQWGAKFAWFFTYVPVGADAAPELMVSAEQRKFMLDRVNAFRKTKPIFVIDFWNDGKPMGGCIAGGKRYLHINANGDIEPCAFIHYAHHNIHTDTLLDALQGPLFLAYRKGQPFNENQLRPCPLLDNPDQLREMVLKTGAKSTEMLHPDSVENLTERCRPIAAEWAKVADELWAYTGSCAGCSGAKQ